MDPIADALTRIRNGYMARLTEVRMPYSKSKEGILHVLEDTGFIATVSVEGEGIAKEIIVLLAYTEKGMPKVERIERISKPSLRKYIKAKDIALIRGGYGVAIVSTSKGIMSSHEARKQGLGGEVIAQVW